MGTVNDAEIPFVMRMSTDGYDWVHKTNVIPESALNGILMASGFNGKVLGFDSSNSSLLIENTGVLKTAIAVSIRVQVQCFPLPGRTNNCPSSLSMTVPKNAAGDPAFDVEVPRSLTSTGNGTIYTLDIPTKRN